MMRAGFMKSPVIKMRGNMTTVTKKKEHEGKKLIQLFF